MGKIPSRTLSICRSKLVTNEQKLMQLSDEQLKLNALLTLADHAEAWSREQGFRVPRRNTKLWQKMYAKWVDFAFETVKKEKK